MTTKEKMLELLENNRGTQISGEKLAQMLGVSRTAIWKAAEQLRREGYPIDAATNKGYCISGDSDILSLQGIGRFLDENGKGLDISVFQSVTSTNDLLREKANSGAKEGTVIISNEQTAGKGRYTRSFYSPKGTGIYLSLLLRPANLPAAEAVKITTIAAVAMCEAIAEVSDLKAQIKWVNDIYLNGRKICGILTEAALGLESGSLDYAVLGVGLNIYAPEEGFPEEIKNKAGFIFSKTKDGMKNHITAAFLNRFMYYYHCGNAKIYSDRYRELSLAVGKEITVICAGKEESAEVYGIDDECRLMVRYRDGRCENLSYGEIEIKNLV